MKTTTMLLGLCLVLLVAVPTQGQLKVGAAVVDVTPREFPVLINGGMISRNATQVKTAVNARAIVLQDDDTQVAVVVVDSCMMPRAFLDDAKQLAAQRTGISAENMLISATHTHTAPASMSCLGTSADPAYVPYLRLQLAEAIAEAQAHLQPARVGWGSVDASDHTALRRWIRRPDRLDQDPFGNPTVRANMHAARNWENVVGESGPEDPELSVVAFENLRGQPIAVLANFSMHYFGDQPVSADYFGLFCEGLSSKIATKHQLARPCISVLSHGCSGDIWRRDYTKPLPAAGQDIAIDQYAREMVDLAAQAFEAIEYQADADLAMAETRLPMTYRVPDAQQLEWARRVVDAMGDRLPQDRTEVYAREQVLLHEMQTTEVVVQAIRIGNIGLATTPTETYALTGLKIKLQSPLAQTMVFDLANGGDGYIPPPEQHRLGGYNTWPARSAGLEIEAEPRITEAAISLLERVSGEPRRVHRPPLGSGGEALMAARPVAYYRLDEAAGPRAVDRSDQNRDAWYEPGVVFFLEGPQSKRFSPGAGPNRSAHFAGGRLRTRIPEIRDEYTIALWCWNGMPDQARPINGWLLSRDYDHGLSSHGDHLGLGGSDFPGKLVYQHGSAAADRAVGSTKLERWKWYQIVFVRQADQIRVFVNGRLDIETTAPVDFPKHFPQLFLGGRSDRQSNWEGRLDEIALFDRALSSAEIGQLLP